MPPVDLNADLIPGTAAAGFPIGARLSECTEFLQRAEEVTYRPGFNLVEAIGRNTGVLVVRNYFPMGSGHTAVFYRADMITLSFNANEELFQVFVLEGYRGRAFGQVGVGSRLQEVRNLFPVVYDDGDEMYYPDLEQTPDAPLGIAFSASREEPLDGPRILGISVHDWVVMRRQ
jgi:hypothetical protein